jgi:hypothetical protein
MTVLLALLLAGTPDGATTVSGPAASEPAAEKKICKRIPTSGTLAGYQRVCRTKAEWQQAANREVNQQAPGAKPGSQGREPNSGGTRN